MTPRHVRVALSICGFAGNERVGMLLGEYGELGAAREIAAGALAPGTSTRFASAVQRAPAVQESAAATGIRFLVPDDDEWPTCLADLDSAAPTGLWCRGNGNLRDASIRQLAVVGARSATTYGERVASDLAAQAAQRGISVVSGGAYGIDAAAHRGALAAGGATVAVMAGGVDVPYPSAHAGLLDRVAVDGLVIGEAAPGAGVRKHAFLTRNRLIAALASDTVVVEAALRSGALNTATWAESLGRELWGIPGPITSPASAGVNRAISQGTMRALADISAVVDSLAAESAPPMEAFVSAEVVGLAADIVRAVAAGASTLDSLCAACARSADDVLPIVTLLEIEGRITRDATGYRVPRGQGA